MVARSEAFFHASEHFKTCFEFLRVDLTEEEKAKADMRMNQKPKTKAAPKAMGPPPPPPQQPYSQWTSVLAATVTP